MKRIFIVLLLIFCFVVANITAFADEHVRGYTKQNGTVVQPYYRSSPNDNVRDNFSYRGNVNPYNGKVGTNRYLHDKTSPYYEGPDSQGRIGHNGSNQPDEILMVNPVHEILMVNPVHEILMVNPVHEILMVNPVHEIPIVNPVHEILMVNPVHER